jgi:hypothetical protein
MRTAGDEGGKKKIMTIVDKLTRIIYTLFWDNNTSRIKLPRILIVAIASKLKYKKR